MATHQTKYQRNLIEKVNVGPFLIRKKLSFFLCCFLCAIAIAKEEAGK